jgi:hypothetical protein
MGMYHGVGISEGGLDAKLLILSVSRYRIAHAALAHTTPGWNNKGLHGGKEKKTHIVKISALSAWAEERLLT